MIKWMKTYNMKWDIQETDIDTFVQYLKPSYETCEVLTGDTIVKPYFDFERYYEVECEDIGDITRETEMYLRNIFSPLNHPFEIVRCSAHRNVYVKKDEKHVFKVSLRFFITGFAIKVKHILKLFECGEKMEGWDFGVYAQGKRALGCINCKKPLDPRYPDDHRVFTIESCHNIKDTIVQYLKGDEFLLELKHEKTNIPKQSDDEITQIINLLNKKRANEYKSWFDIGLAMYNTSQKLLEHFVEFSKQSTKFEKGKCEKLWESEYHKYPNGPSEATLRWLAKQDNPDEYMKLNVNSLRTLIIKSKNATHYDIGVVVHAMFKDEFAYLPSEKGNGLWFHFNNHRWHENGLEDLKKVIFKDVTREYLNTGRKTDDDELCKKMNEIALKLKMTTFVKSVIDACRSLFQVNATKFLEGLDSKPNLLGFNNGVYNLDTGEFNDGFPEDMVSFSTKYNYTTEVNEKYQKIALDFCESIMPDEKHFNYLLDIASYCLHGNKLKELIFFFTGSGGNGKSKLVKLLEKCFGDYFYAPNVAMYTTKVQNSSAATSEKAKLKGRRCACSGEPEEDETFKIGRIKELVGGDKIQARDLYSKPIEFVNQAQIIICMNKLSQLSDIDGGAIRRVRVVNFPFQFKHEPIPRTNQKKIDESIGRMFDDNVEIWQQFMIILLNRFKDLKDRNFTFDEPVEVLEATKSYLHDCNIIAQFIEESLDVTYNDADLISANDLLSEYKYWVQKDKANAKIDKTTFKQGMSTNGFNSYIKKTREGGYHNCTVYSGIKIKEKIMIIDEESD